MTPLVILTSPSVILTRKRKNLSFSPHGSSFARKVILSDSSSRAKPYLKKYFKGVDLI